MIGVLALQGQEQHGVGAVQERSDVSGSGEVAISVPYKVIEGARGHCDGQVLLVVRDGHTIAGIRSISACGLLGSGRVPATTSASS